MKNASTADAPFVFTVNYSPSIAQLSVKGRAQVIGEKGEISKMIDEHKQNRPPLGCGNPGSFEYCNG